MADEYTYLRVRIGDAGECEKFDNLDAVIKYLNELRAGKITGFRLLLAKGHKKDTKRTQKGHNDEKRALGILRI